MHCPNISGRFDIWWSTAINFSGAFFGEVPTKNGADQGGNNKAQYYDGVRLSASRVSNVYSRSNTVQPSSIRYFCLVRT